MTTWLPNISSSSDPIYLAIAKAIVSDVSAGRLKPGDRLPPQRELAQALNVAIGTVTRGYVEASRRGVTRGKSGRGTVVRDLAAEQPDSRLRVGPGGGLVDLGTNVPIHAEAPDLSKALATLAQAQDASRLLHYQAPQQDPRYLAAGAKWIGECGLNVGPESVVVTAGAQHAIMTILGALTKPGDLVYADELTCPALFEVAQLLHLRVQGIGMDEIGLRPDALRSACRQRNGQALYCMPTVHNPTSTILTAERRQELAQVAREYDLLVIEDEVHRHLAPGAAAPISQTVPERGFFIAGLSKAVAPGLRVAYVAAPPFAKEQLNDAVAASLVMVSPLTVELATMWVEDGTARLTADRKRVEAKARQALAREALGDYSYRSYASAYNILLDLPEEWKAGEFANEARRRGVALATASAFSVPGCQPPEAVRVSLGGARDRSELREALAVIAKILSDGFPGRGTRM
ncbi:MAG: PLP-dependent aminotransferase family protein [Phycisphaerales bacterium]|nr:MAG: PLP-dependent aminotransferase family protein [Phycisphaerales bacterium]